MLMFGRNDVIDHIEESVDDDFDAVFLTNFPKKCFLEGLTELNCATWKLPLSAFVAGEGSSFREKDLGVGINDDSASTDADVVNAFSHSDIVP